MLLPHRIRELYAENLTRSQQFPELRSADSRLEYDSLVPSMDTDRLQIQYKVINMLNKQLANKERSFSTGSELFTLRKHLVKKI
jgi:hypothetical protein